MTTNKQKMCGFVGLFDIRQKSDALRTQVLKMSKNIRHRGPDWSGVYCGERAILSHERLSIVDPQSGGQPLSAATGNWCWLSTAVSTIGKSATSWPGSTISGQAADCEVILPLYQKMGVGLLEKISGIFAFALYDIENDEYLIARDPIGVIPLYIGWDRDEQFYVASELKALEGVCTTIQPFLPGHYWSSKEGKMVRWYDRDSFEYDAVKETGADIPALRAALEAAVKRQLMSDVPYGVLLSGGLDSSIISAVARKFADRRVESHDRDRAWWPRLHCFAVGLERLPRTWPAAREVADRIGTVPPRNPLHHSGGSGRRARRDLLHRDLRRDHRARLYADVPAGTRHPKPWASRWCFRARAPTRCSAVTSISTRHRTPRAFHEETVRKLGKLYLYDCLRANKIALCMGRRGTRAFPRQGVPGRGHAA